jgi:predicted RNA-binding protein
MLTWVWFKIPYLSRCRQRRDSPESQPSGKMEVVENKQLIKVPPKLVIFDKWVYYSYIIRDKHGGIAMPERTYWLDLFTGTSWQEFLTAGGNISGFRESRWSTLQKIKPGDYLLCYLTGLMRIIGVLEVTSKPYKDETPIWSFATFPCRLDVKVIVKLTPETAVPILDLRDELSIFRNLKSPKAWTGKIRGSPMKWSRADGEIIVNSLRKAESNPVIRPVDQKKLARRPQAFKAKFGHVTIPASEDIEIGEITQVEITTGEINAHSNIQYLLLKLGNEMGFDIWVARNDRNRIIKGKKLSDHFKLKDGLPLQFDEATNKTIEYIDVLWLKGNAIVAAFEVESTTSIYSGLFRMSDLIAMQPNLNIPLYLVAPDDRRNKVFEEINRPTFSRLIPPLVNVCRFISFTNLTERLKEISPYVRYLKPEFLDELSEACEI